MTMEFRRIRDLREDSDRSQREVAELLYIRRTVYRRYETGERMGTGIREIQTMEEIM